jgi:NarL family two-component system response regulator LiaR
MIRIGLRVSIEDSPSLELVAEAENGRAALDLYKQHRPDVVLMDIFMPEMDGIEASRAILAFDPAARIIALTSHDEGSVVQQAFEAGVTSYLLKDVDVNRLVAAIQDAYQGKATLDDNAAQALMRTIMGPQPVGHDITPGERRVLMLLVAGLSNRQIAKELHISVSTTKKHVSSLISKLHASNRAEVAALAIQHKMVDTSGRNSPG